MVWQEVPLDRIYFDSVTGVPGTMWPIGTPQVPSDVIADTIAICVARHINLIHVTGTLAVGAGIAQTLVGHDATLTGQTAGTAFARDFRGALIIDAMVGGTITIIMNGGTVTINANCTAGTINIYGSAVVTDNSVGAAVNDYTIDQRAANIDTQLDGMLVQVPFYNIVDTIVNDEVILFEFDALGATIREIFVSFYLPLHATATFTPTWRKTRPNDLITFTAEVDPPLPVIATPGVNAYYRYSLGELAQGLQGRFYLAQDAVAVVRTVDAWATALMVV